MAGVKQAQQQSGKRTKCPAGCIDSERPNRGTAVTDRRSGVITCFKCERSWPPSVSKNEIRPNQYPDAIHEPGHIARLKTAMLRLCTNFQPGDFFAVRLLAGIRNRYQRKEHNGRYSGTYGGKLGIADMAQDAGFTVTTRKVRGGRRLKVAYRSLGTRKSLWNDRTAELAAVCVPMPDVSHWDMNNQPTSSEQRRIDATNQAIADAMQAFREYQESPNVKTSNVCASILYRPLLADWNPPAGYPLHYINQAQAALNVRTAVLSCKHHWQPEDDDFDYVPMSAYQARRETLEWVESGQGADCIPLGPSSVPSMNKSSTLDTTPEVKRTIRVTFNRRTPKDATPMPDHQQAETIEEFLDTFDDSEVAPVRKRVPMPKPVRRIPTDFDAAYAERNQRIHQLRAKGMGVKAIGRKLGMNAVDVGRVLRERQFA